MTRLSLCLRALEGGGVPHADLMATLEANVRTGNSLVDSEFDYPASFPEVFTRGGFDVVLGNPPYISYGGRQAVDIPKRLRRYFSKHYRVGGWATAHSLFVERAAMKLSRARVSFIVPDQVGHLSGYRSLREVVTGEGHLVEVKYWGERVFKGVITPSLTFLLDKSEKVGQTRVVDADGTERWALLSDGDAWTASDSRALLDKMRARSTSIRHWVADCGVRTTDAKSQVVDLGRASGQFMPVLEGRQIGRYWCAAPEVAIRLDGRAKVFVSREDKYRRAEFLIRQTAAYPIVGPREHATYFRNSLHALYPPDNGWDVRYVVALLNSKLLRFAYLAAVREAQQRVFPQVKLGPLGALPVRALDMGRPAEKEQHDRLVDMARAILEIKHELMRESDESAVTRLRERAAEIDTQIDLEVFRLYDLTPEEIARVEDVVAAAAVPP